MSNSRGVLAILVALCWASPAFGLDFIAIAVRGQPAPDSGGQTFWVFEEASVDGAGVVAFTPTLSSMASPPNLYVSSGGPPTALVVAGTPAPGGGTLNGPGNTSPSSSPSGDVAFLGSLGSGSNGFFLASGGSLFELMRTGQTAPSTGGAYSALSLLPSLNDAGEVAFIAAMNGGSVATGIFVATSGADRAVALVGDSAPSQAGVTYQGFSSAEGRPSINGDGDVAFAAKLSNNERGIFVENGGAGRAVAVSGQAVPGVGTLGNVGWRPTLNDAGLVVFGANLHAGVSEVITILLIDDPLSDPDEIARRSDPAPGFGGGSEGQFGPFVTYIINEVGDVAFSVASLGSGSAGDPLNAATGVYVYDASTRVIVPVVRSFDLAPGFSGEFGSLGLRDFNDQAQIVFESEMPDGTNALFRVTVPELAADGCWLASTDALPSGFVVVGDPGLLSFDGGLLQVDDDAGPPYVSVQKSDTFGSDWMFEVELRVNSHNRTFGLDTGPFSGIYDGRRQAGLAISLTEVGLVNQDATAWIDSPVSLDATVFHEYRVQKVGSDVTLVVDGTPELTVAYTSLSENTSLDLVSIASTSIAGTTNFDVRRFCYNPTCSSLTCAVPTMTQRGLALLVGLLTALAFAALLSRNSLRVLRAGRLRLGVVSS